MDFQMNQRLNFFVGIVLLVCSVSARAAASQIDDCQLFSEQVTQLVAESFSTRGVMDGTEVKKLKIQYPNVQENRLQMYLASAALNWATSNGNQSRVFEKTAENCRKLH